MRLANRVATLLLLFPISMTGAQQRDAVDDYVERAMARQHIPGLSLVVVRKGKVVKATGYGFASVEHRARAAPTTVYELASTTKPFVATAIMLLAQEKALGLDDRIGRYVDSLPAKWAGVTIRHLLTHTSGIPDYLADLRRDFPHDASADAIARAVLDAAPKFSPGAQWSYSNSGYVLLGLIVKKVSGDAWDGFLAKRVFAPLRMTDTRRDSPDEIVPSRASGYLWYGPGGLHNGDFLKYMMTNHGDRGLLSTALDLAAWDIALTSDQLLAPAMREAMWRPMTLANGASTGYGMGWFVETIRGHRHVHHPGGAPGSAAVIARYPDDSLTIVILANGGAAYPQALDLGIARLYVPQLAPGPVVQFAPPQLDGIAGFYNVFGTQLLTIRRDGSALALDDGGRLAGRFLALSDSAFAAEDADRSFTVRRAGNGTVRELKLRLIGDTLSVPRLGPLPPTDESASDPDPTLSSRIEAVLRAFERGGKPVEQTPGIAPQARRDYAPWPSPEFAGIRGIRYLATHDIAELGISRHGTKVARLLYYRLMLPVRQRTVLVYLTSDGLVTDQDVVD